MAQYLVPTSDQATGGWSTTPLWSKVDDDSSANPTGDGTVIQSADNSAPDDADMAISTGTDPGVTTGHILRARWRRNQNGGHAIYGTLQLWQGVPGTGTLIATLTSAQPIETTEVEDSYTLSGAEAGNITDYSTLYLRVSRQGGTGGPPGGREFLEVDLIELEIPDGVTFVSMEGFGNAASAGASVLRALGDLQGAGSAAASGSAALRPFADLNGAGNAASSGLGTVDILTAGTTWDLNGAGAAASDGLGVLRSFVDLSAASGASVSGVASLRPLANLNGSGSAAASGDGSLGLEGGGAVSLNGAGHASSSGLGALRADNDLSGAGASSTSGAASLNVVVDLQGAAGNAASGNASLRAVNTLTGSGSVAAEGSANLAVDYALFGAGAAAASGLAPLRVGAGTDSPYAWEQTGAAPDDEETKVLLPSVTQVTGLGDDSGVSLLPPKG